MKNFETSELFETLGGCQGFYFAPVNRIASIPEASACMITSPILMRDTYPILRGYASPGSLLFTESAKHTPSGMLNSVALKGFYPGVSDGMIALFHELMTNRFVVLVTDKLGKTRLAGSLREPLSFSFTYSSLSQPNERAGYEFVFSGEMTSTCPIYVPYTGDLGSFTIMD